MKKTSFSLQILNALRDQYRARMDVETITKSIKKDTPCPFGYVHHDLRGCDLNVSKVLVRESNCF